MANLGKRGIKVDRTCPICKVGDESTMHALWLCHKMKMVRREWMSKKAMKYRRYDNFFDLIIDMAKYRDMEDLNFFLYYLLEIVVSL